MKRINDRWRSYSAIHTFSVSEQRPNVRQITGGFCVGNAVPLMMRICVHLPVSLARKCRIWVRVFGDARTMALNTVDHSSSDSFVFDDICRNGLVIVYSSGHRWTFATMLVTNCDECDVRIVHLQLACDRIFHRFPRHSNHCCWCWQSARYRWWNRSHSADDAEWP